MKHQGCRTCGEAREASNERAARALSTDSGESRSAVICIQDVRRIISMFFVHKFGVSGHDRQNFEELQHRALSASPRKSQKGPRRWVSVAPATFKRTDASARSKLN